MGGPTSRRCGHLLTASVPSRSKTTMGIRLSGTGRSLRLQVMSRQPPLQLPNLVLQQEYLVLQLHVLCDEVCGPCGEGLHQRVFQPWVDHVALRSREGCLASRSEEH